MDQSLSHRPSPGLSSAYLWPLSVWLTASLLIHTRRLPHSPAALTKKKHLPHIPYSMTTTISGGRFASETSPPPRLHSLRVCNLCGMQTYTWALHDYSLPLLGLPQAHSCPELESYMYKQFVILLRKLGRFHAPGPAGRIGTHPLSVASLWV